MTEEGKKRFETLIAGIATELGGDLMSGLQELADTWGKPVTMQLTAHPGTDEVDIKFNTGPQPE